MFDYNFDLETELKIYRKVGNKNGFCNYSEWENYVLNKYGNRRCTESSLKNFLHYLKKNQRVIGVIEVRPQCWELSVNLNELYLYALKYVL